MAFLKRVLWWISLFLRITILGLPGWNKLPIRIPDAPYWLEFRKLPNSLFLTCSYFLENSFSSWLKHTFGPKSTQKFVILSKNSKYFWIHCHNAGSLKNSKIIHFQCDNSLNVVFLLIHTLWKISKWKMFNILQENSWIHSHNPRDWRYQKCLYNEREECHNYHKWQKVLPTISLEILTFWKQWFPMWVDIWVTSC